MSILKPDPKFHSCLSSEERTVGSERYVHPSGGAAYGVGWGGGASDKPVPGDYDGDGKTDIAIYRTSTGGWYIIPSSGASP